MNTPLFSVAHGMSKLIYRKIPLHIFCLILLGIYGIFYVGNTLTPSSYGIVLKQIGANQEGLVWGTPRISRSDEWAVVTPLTQAVVNNNFERYNNTSPYKEDLRATFFLPLNDWGAYFKPLFAGFHALPPEYAFSLYYFLTISLFLVGFSLFFYRLGINNLLSINLAILLYFSSCVQNSWTTYNGILAFFPWVYIAATCNKPLYIKIPLFYYLTTCMIFALFYPPLHYTLAFSTILFLYCFHRNFLTFKNIIIFGTCAALALGTYLFYIQDLIEPLSNTIYPAKRISVAGDVGFLQWLSQFLPSINMNIANDICFENGCHMTEANSVGSYLLLLMLIFGKWKEWKENISKDEIRSLLCLLIGFSFITLWQVFYFPEPLAKLIMIDRVPGKKWFFASGIIIIGILVIILKRLEFIFTFYGALVFLYIVVSARFLSAELYTVGSLSNENLIILIPFLALFILDKFHKINKKYYREAIVVVASFSNIIVFGALNPLQSAKPIFNIPQTPAVKALWDKSNFTPEGFFIGSSFAAIENGLGLPALNHALYTPQLKFFRCYFPDMPEEEFYTLFNRYLYVRIGKVAKPINVERDQSFIPMKSLMYNTDPENLNKCLKEGGYLDLRHVSK